MSLDPTKFTEPEKAAVAAEKARLGARFVPSQVMRRACAPLRKEALPALGAGHRRKEALVKVRAKAAANPVAIVRVKSDKASKATKTPSKK